ncbi:hypothetical protein AgCh_027710 [Apium graveolens]
MIAFLLALLGNRCWIFFGAPKEILSKIKEEMILVEISKRCNRKIHVDKRKMNILGGFGVWGGQGATWSYFQPNYVMMKEIMVAKGYDKVVGFVLTGWTYEVKRNKFIVRTKDSFEIHLVPYNEHSNYEELGEYVKFLKPKRVIPSIRIDAEKLDSKHACAMQKYFAGLVDEMAIKQDFLKSFHKGERNSSDKIVNSSTVEIEEKELASDEVQTFKTTYPGFQDQVPGPQDSVLVNENNTEGLLQELHDFLPAWVTRE